MVYVVIDGPTGVGKTSLCKILSRSTRRMYVPEVVDYALPPPVLGPGGDAFRAECWFIRQHILHDREVAKVLSAARDTTAIADRGWGSIRIYAKAQLTAQEYTIIEALVDALPKRQPDVEIILTAPVETLAERVAKRNRASAAKWGEGDTEHLANILGLFNRYYEDFADLKNIHLVDASDGIWGVYNDVKALVENEEKKHRHMRID